MKKIVLISSGQPSINPRLVKEADLLSNSGYEVIVIYSFWIKWAYDSDFVLFKKTNWKPILVGGTPFNNKILFFYTRIRHKLFSILAKWQVFDFNVIEITKGRAYVEMLKKAKSIKADLYIAHNLAALPIAVKAAKFHHAKCGFDAEDFHRQEVTDDINSFEYKSAKYLEDKYLPQVDYITAASPLIAAEYEKLYPQLNPVVINNVFSSQTQNLPNVQNWEGLRLFWFSQTVGKGRGLEDVIKAIGILKNENISFTLLGSVTSAVKEYLLELVSANGLQPSQLIFLDPIAPDDIIQLASKYDVGMALEPGFSLNNKLALSNKLFTYLISSIAVIASETQAQKQFMQSFPTIGKTYPIGDIGKLAEIMQYYIENSADIQKAKEASFALSKNELNWEKESVNFLKILTNL